MNMFIIYKLITFTIAYWLYGKNMVSLPNVFGDVNSRNKQLFCLTLVCIHPLAGEIEFLTLSEVLHY